MADEKERVKTPWGSTGTADLTPGAQGSGAGGSTDTGGLDAEGNELGAADTGTATGKSEGQREDEAVRAAHENA